MYTDLLVDRMIKRQKMLLNIVIVIFCYCYLLSKQFPNLKKYKKRIHWKIRKWPKNKKSLQKNIKKEKTMKKYINKNLISKFSH